MGSKSKSPYIKRKRSNGTVKKIQVRPLQFKVFSPKAVALIKEGRKDKVMDKKGVILDPSFLKVAYKVTPRCL